MLSISQPPVVRGASCNLFFISMGNKVGDGLAVSDFVCQWAEVGLDLNDYFFLKRWLPEELARDEVNQARLFHKEANAICTPPPLPKSTEYGVLSNVLLGSSYGRLVCLRPFPGNRK